MCSSDLIADNGCGFDPRSIPRDHGRHWGLTIMEERAQQIGGRVAVTSVPNEGTIVKVIVPCSGVGKRDAISNPDFVRR